MNAGFILHLNFVLHFLHLILWDTDGRTQMLCNVIFPLYLVSLNYCLTMIKFDPNTDTLILHLATLDQKMIKAVTDFLLTYLHYRRLNS